MQKKTVLILLSLILLFSVCENIMIPHLGKPVGRSPPRFKLDLNLPPQKRWVEIAKAYQIYLEEAVVVIDILIDRLPNKLKKLFITADLWALTTFQYKEMAQEVKGIADTVHIPFSKIFFLNFMYEFSTFKACSSIIVRNETGHILHGRNLDFEFFDRFSKLAATVDVYRGDQYVYTLEALVGAVFGLTAVKPGMFSATVDTRKDKSQGFLETMNNLVVKNYYPSTWLLRKVFDEELSWESAVKRLNFTEITAPIYFIVAGVGPNEGAVIERESTKAHGYYQLNDTTWFLVQTNYDRDQEDPSYDKRRIPAEKRLNDLGQKITIDDLFTKVMFKWPTFNVASIYTFTTIPAIKYSNLTCWYGVNNITPSKNETTEVLY